MGDPSTPNLNFYYLEHCFENTFLSSMLKKIDWHPLKPVPTHYQQGKAIFRILVIFAHLCKAMGDPSTPYLKFYGLEYSSGDSFLSSNLKKSDWYPLKPLPTHHQQGDAIFRILVILAHLCTAMGPWSGQSRSYPNNFSFWLWYFMYERNNLLTASTNRRICSSSIRPIDQHKKIWCLSKIKNK